MSVERIIAEILRSKNGRKELEVTLLLRCGERVRGLAKLHTGFIEVEGTLDRIGDEEPAPIFVPYEAIDWVKPKWR